jgi:DNA-binding CsgD family transcriptional regulator/ketosteroid isomerase-like protein
MRPRALTKPTVDDQWDAERGATSARSPRRLPADRPDNAGKLTASPAGLARGGAKGLAMLGESTAVLGESPAVLERAASLVEWGAALRRAGQRSQARRVLSQGLDGAARCGARPLAARAREELRVAGARPRRDWSVGVEALTPSELRIVRLARAGHTNRQIAQELYVSIKTVEGHLARAYGKLDIASRRGSTAYSIRKKQGCPPSSDATATRTRCGSPGRPHRGRTIERRCEMLDTTMTETAPAEANGALIQSAYDAFSRADIQGAIATFAEDIFWHVPGRGALARDYHGRAEVLGFFAHFMELSGGRSGCRSMTSWPRATASSCSVPRAPGAAAAPGRHRRSTSGW